jgi:flagellar basal body-associated protein FliL
MTTPTDEKPKRRGCQRIIWIIVAVGILIAGIVLLLPAIGTELAKQSWTGFGKYEITEKTEVTRITSQGTETEESTVTKPQREKTAWDWIQIFLVPLVLAITGGIISFTIQRNQQERTEALAQVEKDRAGILARAEGERTREMAAIERERMVQQINLSREQMLEQLRITSEHTVKQESEKRLQDYFDRVTNLIAGGMAEDIERITAIIRVQTIQINQVFDNDLDKKELIYRFLGDMPLLLKSTSVAGEREIGKVNNYGPLNQQPGLSELDLGNDNSFR